MPVILAEDYLWRKVFKCLDKLDRITVRMETHCDVLEEMDKEEQEQPERPVLVRVK
jgi:hypothetical protein